MGNDARSRCLEYGEHKWPNEYSFIDLIEHWSNVKQEFAHVKWVMINQIQTLSICTFRKQTIHLDIWKPCPKSGFIKAFLNLMFLP